MPDKEQGPCLQGEETYRHMVAFFDEMPPEQREILRNSRFNICGACFSDYLFRFQDPKITLQHIEEAIKTGDYEKLYRDARIAYAYWRSKFEQPYVVKWRKE